MSDATAGFKDTIEVSDDGGTTWENLGELKNPSFPQSRGSIDASVTGKAYVDRIPGRYDNSVSYECIDKPADAGQAILTAASDGEGAAAQVDVRFVRNGTARRKATFIVLGSELTSDLDGTAMISFSLESISAPSAA